MRLLYISCYYKPAFIYGGPVTAVSSLLEALVKQGVEVLVQTTNANGLDRLQVPCNIPVNINGVKVIYHPLTGKLPGNFFYSPSLVSSTNLTMPEYDIVIVDGLWSYLLRPTLLNTHRLHKPSIVFLHGQLMPWALRYKWLKKRIFMFLITKPALNKANAIHCASFIEYQGLNSLKLKPPAFIVPFGIDYNEYIQLPTSGFLRRKFDLDTDTQLLLQVGRIHEVKHPELLVEMLTLIGKKNIHLIFAGPDEGGLIEKLRSQAEQAGYGANVHFTGMLNRPEVIQALVDADLFVLSSRMESYGMAALEAMAAGLPILVADTVPVGQWAVKSGAGVQVPNNSLAFSIKAGELLNNQRLLKAMGKRGREVIKKEFDQTVVAKQMLDHFRTLISTGTIFPETIETS